MVRGHKPPMARNLMSNHTCLSTMCVPLLADSQGQLSRGRTWFQQFRDIPAPANGWRTQCMTALCRDTPKMPHQRGCQPRAKLLRMRGCMPRVCSRATFGRVGSSICQRPCTPGTTGGPDQISAISRSRLQFCPWLVSALLARSMG